jgi:hypothetical protein
VYRERRLRCFCEGSSIEGSSILRLLRP